MDLPQARPPAAVREPGKRQLRTNQRLALRAVVAVEDAIAVVKAVRRKGGRRAPRVTTVRGAEIVLVVKSVRVLTVNNVPAPESQ